MARTWHLPLRTRCVAGTWRSRGVEYGRVRTAPRISASAGGLCEVYLGDQRGTSWFAESSGEAWFFWSGANDTTSTTATADGESAEQYCDTEFELAEHSGEDDGATSAAAAAVAQSADGARPSRLLRNHVTKSSPCQHTRLRARARGKCLLWKCIINEWIRLAQSENLHDKSR